MKQKLSGKLGLVLFTFLALTAHKSHKVLRVQAASRTQVVPCLLALTPCIEWQRRVCFPSVCSAPPISRDAFPHRFGTDVTCFIICCNRLYLLFEDSDGAATHFFLFITHISQLLICSYIYDLSFETKWHLTVHVFSRSVQIYLTYQRHHKHVLSSFFFFF